MKFVSIYSLAVICFFVGVLEYSDSRTLNGPFLLDDQGTIKFHSFVWEKTANFTKLFFKDYWGTDLTSPTSHKSWRPLVTYSFRLQSGQLGVPPADTFAYHFVNVLIHGLNSFLACLCARFFIHFGSDNSDISCENSIEKCDFVGESGSIVQNNTSDISFNSGSSSNCGYQSSDSSGDSLNESRWSENKIELGEGVHKRHNKNKDFVAFVAGLLFAAHPIHTEAVSNITGRAEEMCSLFFLLGFLIYALRSSMGGSGDHSLSWNREFVTAILVSACTVLSLVSKEQGILLPPICLAWDILSHSIYEPSLYSFNNTKKVLRRNFIIKLASLSVFTCLLTFWRLSLNGDHPPDLLCIQNPASCSPFLLARFLSFSYLYVVNSYFLVFPLWSAPDWSGEEFPVITTLFNWKLPSIILFYLFFVATIIQGILYSFLPSSSLFHQSVVQADTPNNSHISGDKTHSINSVASSCPSCVSRKNCASFFSNIVFPRTVVLSICWCTGTFLLNSNLITYVGFVFNERGLYLPSFGFCVITSFLLFQLCEYVTAYSEQGIINCKEHSQHPKKRRQNNSNRGLLLFLTLTGIIFALYTKRLQTQNLLWSDSLILWENAHHTAPKATISTGEYSLVLVERKRYDEAIPFLADTLKFLPHLYEKAFLLSLAYQATGRCNLSMKVLKRSQAAVEQEFVKKVKALKENKDVPTKGIYHSNSEDWKKAKLAQLEGSVKSARSFLAIAESRCLSVLVEAGLMALKAVEHSPSKEAIGHAQNLDARVSHLMGLKLDPRRVITWYEDDGQEHFAYDAEDMQVVALIKQHTGVFPRHLLTAADRRRLGVDGVPGATKESHEKNVQVLVGGIQRGD